MASRACVVVAVRAYDVTRLSRKLRQHPGQRRGDRHDGGQDVRMGFVEGGALEGQAPVPNLKMKRKYI